MKNSEHKEEHSTRTVRVSDLVVDFQNETVVRGALRIELPYLSFQLLSALIKAAPKTLATGELIEQVWDGVSVSDDALKQRVKLLREALDEDGSDEGYVTTVRGRGYKLAAPVLPVHTGAQSTKIWMKNLAPWQKALVAVGLIIVLVVAINRYTHEYVRPEDQAVRIAVTSFQAVGAGVEQATFAEGVEVELAGHLSRVAGFEVVASPSVQALQDQRSRDMGRELSADVILEGDVRTGNDSMRLSVRLIDTRSEAQLWTREYDVNYTESLALQAKIASQISALIHEGFEPQLFAIIISDIPARNLAYEHYMRGVDFSKSGVKSSEMSEVEYRAALDIDPDFAHARAKLAEIFADRWLDGEGDVWASQALEEASAAVALRPDLAEAQFAYGKALLANGRIDEAFSAFEQAVVALPYLLLRLNYYRELYADS